MQVRILSESREQYLEWTWHTAIGARFLEGFTYRPQGIRLVGCFFFSVRWLVRSFQNKILYAL